MFTFVLGCLSINIVVTCSARTLWQWILKESLTPVNWKLFQFPWVWRCEDVRKENTDVAFKELAVRWREHCQSSDSSTEWRESGHLCPSGSGTPYLRGCGSGGWWQEMASQERGTWIELKTSSAARAGRQIESTGNRRVGAGSQVPSIQWTQVFLKLLGHIRHRPSCCITGSSKWDSAGYFDVTQFTLHPTAYKFPG